MNKTILIQALVFFIFFTFSNGYAQNLKEESQLSITDQDKFITLSQVNNALSVGSESSSLSNGVNAVFIQQIGTSNAVLSTIIAESSDIKIIQRGDQNLVEINEFSREIEKSIIQTGNNNSVTDFSFNPDISTNLELLQEGNNLIFERFGSNELSKNLKFKMSGDARTIIVRSF
ncbi:Curlin associated repeat-containing protein [Aquimarina sp. MAR_2010_214]|uniref:hypothetical protein n=1 Tax=Aquimarina sp. MAR_2010_214 TaxID=1250026 RepID=UPI000C7022AB|nr:hypothetical protein [Aquimarina sp. MAR_2010_214]PKV52541.1 Curlin associated repeat-containing protein [Aquimarina sp. MAR_2010_214]